MNSISLRAPKWIAAAVIACTMWSCSKDKVQQPVTAAETDLASASLLAGETAERQPTPGIYTMFRFIDTGGDETAQFNGYKFEFQADNDFIATDNRGIVHNGRWRLNSAETRMTLVISGTEALEDLDDDDWKVDRITNTRIRISAPGPDIAVFVMQ